MKIRRGEWLKLNEPLTLIKMPLTAGVTFKIRRKKHFPDIIRFTNALHIKATTAWNRAITAFIITVAQEVARHQHTSMSLASLFATARKVRALTKLPPATPKVANLKGFTDIDGTYYSEGFRNRKVGEYLGERSSKILYGSPFRPVFRFEFEINVYQYLIHELGWQTPAWESLQKGRTAMLDYLNQYGREAFPRLHDWFVLEKGLITPEG